MASKGWRHRKQNINLQGEPDMLQQRLTTEDRTAHARGNTSSTTRTQVGRRISTRYMHKEAPSMVRHAHHRHGNVPSVESEFMSDAFQQEDEESNGGATGADIIEKETRGPTYMKSIWGHPPNQQPIPVEYNEFGQPIGGEISKLTHFLGSIARNGKYCPLDVNS